MTIINDYERQDAVIRQYFLLAFFIVFIVTICALFVTVVWFYTLRESEKLGFDSYVFSELLINYEGGFVRRGFLGQLFHGFAQSDTIILVNKYVFFTSLALAFCLLIRSLSLMFSKGQD